MIFDRRWLALAALVILPLYLWAGLGNRDVWAPDEPRYALVAREMQERGNYALPTVNGEPYAHKPPLLFWLMTASSRLTGAGAADPFSARLPSALAGVGTLCVTSALGARLFGPGVAALAPLVLATAHMFCWEAHAAQMDCLLTFWIALGLLCLVAWREEGRARHAYGFALACGLATLTKGPVGFVIPWAVAWLWARDKGDVACARGLFRPACLAVFAGPVLAWLAAATAYGGQEYVEQLLGRHVVERYLNSWHHVKPFWFYLADLPLEWLPWTLALPATLAYAHGARRERGVRFVAVWVLFMLAFFSFPKGKRGLYMLPALPPLALLTAAALDAAARGAERVRRLALVGLVATPALFLVLLNLLGSEALGQRAVAIDVTAVKVAVGLALATTACAYGVCTVPAVVRATVLSTALVFLAGYASVLGQLDVHKSPRAFCAKAASLRRPGEALGYYGVYLEAYGLFTGERMLLGEQAMDFLPHLNERASILAFMQSERMKDLTCLPWLKLDVLVEDRVGDKFMVIARVSER